MAEDGRRRGRRRHVRLAALDRAVPRERAGVPTVVVDHGSSDGTVAFVRERFPDVRMIEAENRGLAAGWNVGLRETESRYVLFLNADAWLVGDALDRLVELADARPRAAVLVRASRTRTGRSSARSAASLRSGAWRPSTSSCASLRPLVGPECFLRGRVRSRRGTRGGGRHGFLHARSSRRRRRGRRCRRGLLPLQRGDRLVLPLPEGGLASRLLPGRRVRARARGARTAGACIARTCAGTCGSSRSTTARGRRTARAACSSPRSGSAG